MKTLLILAISIMSLGAMEIKVEYDEFKNQYVYGTNQIKQPGDRMFTGYTLKSISNSDSDPVFAATCILINNNAFYVKEGLVVGGGKLPLFGKDKHMGMNGGSLRVTEVFSFQLDEELLASLPLKARFYGQKNAKADFIFSKELIEEFTAHVHSEHAKNFPAKESTP